MVANVLSRVLDSSKPLGVPYQIKDTSLFSIEPIWMQEVKSYSKIGQMLKTFSLA